MQVVVVVVVMTKRMMTIITLIKMIVIVMLLQQVGIDHDLRNEVDVLSPWIVACVELRDSDEGKTTYD